MSRYVTCFSEVFPLVFEYDFRISFEFWMSNGTNASEVRSRTDYVLRKARVISKCPSVNSIQPMLKENLQTCRKLSI